MADLAHRVIPEFSRIHGRLPRSLDELEQELEGDLTFFTVDGWDRPLLYSVSDAGPIRLVSLGRDGRAGGAGVDADIRYPEDF